MSVACVRTSAQARGIGPRQRYPMRSARRDALLVCQKWPKVDQTFRLSGTDQACAMTAKGSHALSFVAGRAGRPPHSAERAIHDAIRACHIQTMGGAYAYIQATLLRPSRRRFAEQVDQARAQGARWCLTFRILLATP